MKVLTPSEPIFVVHADDDDRMELCEALEEHGWDPIPFENASGALAAMPEHPDVRFLVIDHAAEQAEDTARIALLRRRHLSRGGAVVVVNRERLAAEVRHRALSQGVEEALEVARSFAEHRPRILLVDDEPSVQRLWRELFSPRYEVITAVSGESAVEQLGAGRVDLIVVDEHLPGISGAELIRRVRGDGQAGSYMMISGDPAARDAATGVGIAIFVEKPFSVDLLEKAVDTALRIPDAYAGAEGPRL